MNRTMIGATNTLNQLQKQMDVIGHNLANSETNGYKRREAMFSELLVQSVNNQRDERDLNGRLTPAGIRQGAGAKLGQSEINLTQGALKSTGRNLDFALTAGNQFFKVLVQGEDGADVRYTRDGAFYANPIGNGEVMLVNGQGHAVLDENDNFITFNENAKGEDIVLRDSGQLTIGGVPFNLGVVSLEKPQFMEQIGQNLLGLPQNLEDLGVNQDEILTNMNGALRNNIGLAQSSLEGSNVDIGKEMTDMMNVQRAYQFQSRSISMADQMMGLVNGIR
ncbi:flagellar hook-basal body protein [Rossellomorea vietnamensis]|uniref:Flagellar hook-basal body protein n=2 Tax=Rossellomorea TaxID=2837508 RepID=A0A5D4KD68_9BACI|nr:MULTISPECIES: flagellar hook-basal body protein [Rossellomorea]TYR75264.1 flagellar hook-basal body protein [Rossellomorea vietnamensis]TYS78434.1 flagellar hook-basal body protein [Rossellomorea aquimaris]